MKELKILGIVIALTVITYIGVEPFAHSQMHPHVDPVNYDFAKADDQSALEKIEFAEQSLKDAEKSKDEKKIKAAQNDVKVAKAEAQASEQFWESVKPILALKGNAQNGEAAMANCTGCHSITAKGFPPIMDNAANSGAYGVVPPDLSTAGKLYSKEYLAAFIMNPAKASKVEHKFQDGRTHPMPAFNYMQPQEIADLIAYLQAIAPKEMTNKEVFADACQRCHSIKYADMQKGTMGAYTLTPDIKKYMGKVPPDLSQYIRSRGHEYLETFINDPQKHLSGTAMPRVGLNEESQKQVITYLEEVGDSKKAERENLGPKFLIYLVIFAIFAWLWKSSKWREVH
ncbi:MAG: cytochrome c1 [Arcobacter sp.]|nr:cytochrome c1 [Arcobacter sp.]